MMKKEGSITVFLSIILLLIFSFVLNFIEMARIYAGRAYLGMTTSLAKEVCLSEYYYNLFEDYGLLGIFEGETTGLLSLKDREDKLEKELKVMLEDKKGGMLDFSDASVEIGPYMTITDNKGADFIAQIRENGIFEGLNVLIAEIIGKDCGETTEKALGLAKKQQEAEEKLSLMNSEFLKLMMVLDGIVTNDEGVVFDENGRIRVADYFVKQIGNLSEEEYRSRLGNTGIYEAVSGKLVNGTELASDCAEMLSFALEYKRLSEKLKGELEEEKKKIEEEEATSDEYISHKEAVLLDTVSEYLMAATEAEAQYLRLSELLTGVLRFLENAIPVVEEMTVLQEAGKIAVKAFELFMKDETGGLTEEYLGSFRSVLSEMKAYAGLDEKGFSAAEALRELKEDESILSELTESMPKLALTDSGDEEISAKNEEVFEACIAFSERASEELKNYKIDALFIPYGEIKPVKKADMDVENTYKTLLAGGFLSFMGIDDASENELTGTDLVSGMFGEDSFIKGVQDLGERLGILMSGSGLGGFLSETGEEAANRMALESFLMRYFGQLHSEKGNTKLLYEREYVLFGNKNDKQNLALMAAALVAVRTIFTTANIITDPGKMSELSALAFSTAGFTGIPMAVTAVKYGLLALWALEEAIVEAAILMNGKSLPVLSTGHISLPELLLFSPEMVRLKVYSAAKDMGGLSYRHYICLFSLLTDSKTKAARTMDLIQENLRMRYRDSFRMRNVVVSMNITAEASLKRKYALPGSSDKLYTLKLQDKIAFSE